MPVNRTSGRLLLELTELSMERDQLRLEVDLLREQLRRHAAGELQIREVERQLVESRPDLMPKFMSPQDTDDRADC